MQERVLTLEQAVHKVTGHAADRFGFEKKGVIAAGMDADLLLFSPENVREHGTYARPNLPATGFDEVFVLGERVIENGVYCGGWIKWSTFGIRWIRSARALAFRSSARGT